MRQMDPLDASSRRALAGCRRLVLSPHLDDAALSCGGMLAVWAAQGQRPAVVTVCAGRPAGPLTDFARRQHERWGVADDLVGWRRGEDAAALAVLGATPVWLDVPDCIYRSDAYASEAGLFGPLAADDAALAGAVAAQVRLIWAATDAATVYAPLGLGRHVDHQVTHAAAQQLQSDGLPLVWYEEIPYVMRPGGAADLAAATAALQPEVVQTSGAGALKVVAVAQYTSQVPVLFGSAAAMAAAVQAYSVAVGDGTPAERVWHIVA